ncbi:efflux RND transporter periplasmic adaptor subunit [Hyphomicrobium sp. DMF-1]|jgi:RND family efflux transporter MFP subunit|uniref:efflux RND transporter periplasmic adaptor subunit n=1 Tax=Hyphomicrobium sp. DMF-1 TaxID=3019544 RepID=UPI0022EBF50C|nr:efflux RND transporter periplasmic adaptor subunit [Hyphomicrobium sp. DMF-1]WBT36753.1 efflux RND transporter periplasmic adaptor subunit [Hyphomicrobium sp. DMF-1]
MSLRTILVSNLAIGTIVGGGVWLATQKDSGALFSQGLKTLGLRTEKAVAEAAPEKEKKVTLRSVRVVRPEAAKGGSTLTLAGRTAPAEQALISSRATGVVAERHVDIGDHVKEGDVLVVIEAPEVEQELLRARASADQMKARLELARATLDRAESLVGKGHVSEQTVDERRATKMSADADLAAALAEVKRLEEVQSFQTIRAPFAGTVVARQVERGDKVTSAAAGEGSYLLRIGRLNELRIEIDVPQSYALKVEPGAQARVSFAELPDQTFSARVVRASGLIDQTSSTMRAELLMPNPGNRIPAGLSGQVSIDLGAAEGAVTVPTNTLVTREGRQMVAIVDAEDRVRLKPVAVSRDLGERVVIASGLTVEDRVIVSPNALLRAGDQVEIVTPTARAAPAAK